MPQDPRFMEFADAALTSDMDKLTHSVDHVLKALILEQITPSIEISIALVVLGLSTIQHSGTVISREELERLNALAAIFAGEILPDSYKDKPLGSHFESNP